MNNNDKLIKKLEARFEKGEISEEIYNELKEALEEKEDVEINIKLGPKGRSDKISISGAGKLSGPIYTKKLSVSGAAKVDGDVDALLVKSSGSLKIDGNVKAEEIGSSGALSVTGNVDSESLRNSGGMKIHGNIKTGILKNSGSLKVIGPAVASEIIKISGSIHAERLEAPEIRISGAFDIDEDIKGDEIIISVGGKCTAKSVIGKEIEISPGNTGRFFSFTIGTGPKKVKVDSIKGTTILLANVQANTVTGNQVEIGPGCVIGTLKAKTSKVHEDSKVKKRIKTK